MKKEMKGFVAGVAITTLLSTTIFTVYAEPIGKTVTVFYKNIKIFVDGSQIQPKDEKGNKTEPFIYNGTTYLPVRAVSDAMGKSVTWDAKTNSLHIDENNIKDIKQDIDCSMII